MVLYLDIIIERFLLGVETCSSVDCVLVRLSSAVMELEDLCREFGWDNRDAVRDFLQDKRVIRVITGLYRSVSSVLYRIETDPRFKVLKPYEDLLYESIVASRDRGIKPIRVFKDVTRPPLWRIEYEEKHPETAKEYPLINYEATIKPSMDKTSSDLPVYARKSTAKEKQGSSKKRSWGKLVAILFISIVGTLILFHLVPLPGIIGSGMESTHSSYPPHQEWWFTSDNSVPIGEGVGSPTGNSSYVSGASKTTSNLVNRLVLNDLRIYANSSYIVFWIRSRMEPLVFLEEANGEEYNIVPYRPSLVNDIPADLVVADRGGYTMYISFQRLARIINGQCTCEFMVYPVDIMVKAWIDPYNHEIRIVGNSHVDLVVEKKGIQNSIYSVVLDSLDSRTLETLRRVVWGGHVPIDKASIVWSLVNYTAQHFSYDYAKANMTDFYIYYPETMLREKKGVCIDYAVFYAVSLIAAGFNKSYIFTVETSSGGHAFAAARINGTYYVLDQKLPVPEISDYYQYSKTILEAKIHAHAYVYEIKITGTGPKIVFHEIDLSRIPDSYPGDKIDGRLIFQTLIDLAKQLHIRASLVVEEGSNMLEYNNWTILHLYTPKMVKEWAQYLADIIATDLLRAGAHLNYVAIKQNGPVSIIVYYK